MLVDEFAVYMFGCKLIKGTTHHETLILEQNIDGVRVRVRTYVSGEVALSHAPPPAPAGGLDKKPKDYMHVGLD
jgi:hypothetical protein